MDQKYYSIHEFLIGKGLSEVLINTFGQFLFCLDLLAYPDGVSISNTNLYVKFDNVNAPGIPLRKNMGIKVPFSKLYFTNFSSFDATVKILIAPNASKFSMFQSEGEILGKGVTNVIIGNVTCTNSAQEYDYDIHLNPAKTIMIKARGGDLKLAFAVGTSGTIYTLIKDGSGLILDDLLTGYHFYFQSPTAGAVAEIIYTT